MENIKEYVEHFRQELVSFCVQHHKLYLYGAGKIGRVYLQILRFLGIEPKGFIISDGEVSIVDGITIFPVASVKKSFTKNTGIIAAFKGADEERLRPNVGPLPNLFFPTEGMHELLLYDLIVFPFLQEFRCGCQPLKEKSAWKNILIIRLDVLGDLIMTTPFLRELRRNCPDSHITLVVRPSNQLLFQNCPYISELLLYDCEQDVSPLLSLETLQHLSKRTAAFAQKKLDRHYDVVFQMCSLLGGRAAWEALFLGYTSGADCQVGRVYYTRHSLNKNKYLYERFQEMISFVSCDMMPKHEVACMLDMLRQCGVTVQNERLELWFHDSETQRAALRSFIDFKEASSWIAVGVVGRLPYQCWPVEHYRQFIEHFSKAHSNVRFVLLGGQEAESTALEIMNTSPNTECVIDLTGKTTLTQVAAVLEKCALYVGANTGLMHMAAALGKPVVEISSYVRNEDGGENNPMGPWGVPTVLLQKQGLDGCVEICSKPYPHCITQITVDEVQEAAEHLMKSIYESYN